MENRESPWGREQRRGSPRPFSSKFKKRSDQKGKLFDTHEDFAIISPRYIFLGISIQSQLRFSCSQYLLNLIWSIENSVGAPSKDRCRPSGRSVSLPLRGPISLRSSAMPFRLARTHSPHRESTISLDVWHKMVTWIEPLAQHLRDPDPGVISSQQSERFWERWSCFDLVSGRRWSVV
jgi:hypothetical protein